MPDESLPFIVKNSCLDRMATYEANSLHLFTEESFFGTWNLGGRLKELLMTGGAIPMSEGDWDFLFAKGLIMSQRAWRMRDWRNSPNDFDERYEERIRYWLASGLMDSAEAIAYQVSRLGPAESEALRARAAESALAREQAKQAEAEALQVRTASARLASEQAVERNAYGASLLMEYESGHTSSPITKADFGLDSNVKYRFEGRGVSVYGTIQNLLGWFCTFAWLCQALLVLYVNADFGFFWFIVSGVAALLIFHRSTPDDHDNQDEDPARIDALIRIVSPSLPALRRYESALINRYKKETTAHNARLQEAFREAHEDAIRAASEAAYAKRLARLRDLQESFEDRGTARARGKELLDMLDSNTGEDLEILVRGLFEVRGWNAKLTARGPDGGIDVIADRLEGPRRVTFAVQVKHWASNIPEKEVRDFWGACSGRYDNALFVTTSSFNKAALSFIRERAQDARTKFSYLDGPKLLNAIDNLSGRDFDRMMVPLKARLGSNPVTPSSDSGRKKLLSSNDAQFHLDRGMALNSGPIDEYEQAIGEFDEAIRLDPGNAIAYYERGRAYHQLDQYERAIQDYDEAIRLDPGNAEAYYDRGTAYHNLEQYERGDLDHGEAHRLGVG